MRDPFKGGTSNPLPSSSPLRQGRGETWRYLGVVYGSRRTSEILSLLVATPVCELVHSLRRSRRQSSRRGSLVLRAAEAENREENNS
jgi:hypothetical protein